MAYCDQCGASLKEGAKFCPQCGTSISPSDSAVEHAEPETRHEPSPETTKPTPLPRIPPGVRGVSNVAFFFALLLIIGYALVVRAAASVSPFEEQTGLQRMSEVLLIGAIIWIVLGVCLRLYQMWALYAGIVVGVLNLLLALLIGLPDLLARRPPPAGEMNPTPMLWLMFVIVGLGIPISMIWQLASSRSDYEETVFAKRRYDAARMSPDQ